MSTNTQHAIDLMPQLRDILGLAADLDLPRLYRITMTAYDNDPGWSINAMLSGTGTRPDLELWEGLRAWAPGVMPELAEPKPSSLKPSGMSRKASVAVVVAEVSVLIWTIVDSRFIPSGWCCAESYQAKGPCSDCEATGQRGEVGPKPVHLTGAFVDFLLGEDVTA